VTTAPRDSANAVAGATLGVLALLAAAVASPRPHAAPKLHATPPTKVAAMKPPPKPAPRRELTPDEVALIDDGRMLYEICVSCHLPDGQGSPGANPPLIGPHIADAPAGRLIRTVLHGMVGPAKIAGADYDGIMPGGQVTDDRDIAAVLTYIRRSWGNQGGVITPTMVKAVRDATADRSEPWTAPELDALK